MDDNARVETALSEIERVDQAEVVDEYVAVVEALGDLADAIAERDATEELESPDDWDDEEWREAVDNARQNGDVPSGKGTVTRKTINGNEYYYLQWREGDRVRSQYIAPVDPS